MNKELCVFGHCNKDMALADCSMKETRKHRHEKSKSMQLPGTSSLASMESLTMPLVQEVVVSADIRCSECQKRVADIISRMKGECCIASPEDIANYRPLADTLAKETESMSVSVLEKKVSLTCKSPAGKAQRQGGDGDAHRSPLRKISMAMKIFQTSCS